jgi:hypothetical protein
MCIRDSVGSEMCIRDRSYYHLIEKFRNDYEYVYISEFYEDFSYKQNLQGFEFWNGSEWKREKKYTCLSKKSNV